MTGGITALILDGLIMLLLAGTIYFAARLYFQLKTFQQSRKELEGLINDLAIHVDKAENAIEGLRENARESGRDMQAVINEARALSDELQIMTETGNNLAARLERLAETRPGADYRPKENPAPKAHAAEQTAGPFSIRDRDLSDKAAPQMTPDGTFPGEEDDEDDNRFGSRAEKELFEALQKRKKSRADSF